MDGSDNFDFDLCEYIRSHEMTMRRLLSMLRQSQSYCTDTECFDEPQSSASCETNFVLILMVVAFALFMYYLRPSSSRRGDFTKPNNINGAPPQPPSSM